MKEKNFLEDFRLALRLYACTMDGEQKEEIGFPDYDFRAVFYTDGNKANAYTASCIGGKCTNCFNDNGRVCVVFNNHRLGLGVLNVEFTAYIPDGYYPDGDQRSVVPAPLDVKLVRHATPCPKDIEVDLMLPYIQFRYKDLTDAEKAELMRPATEAAQRADDAVAKAETATAEAVKSNQELAKNVTEAEKSELQRQQAEEERKAAEARRSEAEARRVEAEAARVLAESGRVDAEGLRKEAEKARREAEGSRAGAEAVRGDSEARRVEAEAARAKAESARQSAENTRKDAEAQRGTNEDARKAAETSRAVAETARQAAESGRNTAEDARAKAESDRRTEFAGWKDTIDGKVGRKEYTEGMAGKLDKSVWDGYNEQFSLNGFYNGLNGELIPSQHWVATPLMPLNTGLSLVFRNLRLDGNASVCIYGANRVFLKSWKGPGCNSFTISPKDFPKGALYFSVTAHANESAASSYAHCATREEREKALTDTVAAAKYALFIDQWNAAWGAYGKYDPVNAPDALHPFYGNTLWMTYEEAISVYCSTAGKTLDGSCPVSVFNKSIRTNIPLNAKPSVRGDGLFGYCFEVQVIRINSYHGENRPTTFTNLNNAFRYCYRLKRIIGALQLSSSDVSGAFFQCNALEDVHIFNLASDISFAYSPRLLLDSISYMVTNAANTKAITVTLHPDVYAKLTGDTSNAAAAALDADELAQWQQVCADAAAKNISFATV